MNRFIWLDPPPAAPSALLKTKTAYSLWFKIYNDFPKAHRYILGGKIEDYFLGLLENIFISIYLPSETKIHRLIIAISKLDGVKFFLQIAWENKCVKDEKYSKLSESLEEIGRMLGGWKKGLEVKQNKTPHRGEGETVEFRNYDAMSVLGVPDVVVRELVDVHLQTTIVVEVHVGNEELYDEPSISPPI